jgi:hypothetical protein
MPIGAGHSAMIGETTFRSPWGGDPLIELQSAEVCRLGQPVQTVQGFSTTPNDLEARERQFIQLAPQQPNVSF